MRGILLCLLLLAAGLRCSAQWAVIDPSNLVQNTMTAANTLEQLAKASQQITNQIQQIRHMEDQLRRIGKMSDVRRIPGFPQFKRMVETPSRLRKWDDLLTGVDGFGIMRDTRGGVYRVPGATFLNYDGVAVAYAADDLKPAQAVTAQADNFKAVQDDVYRQREELKAAIAETSEALRLADTEAEEMKLQATLHAQYGQMQELNQQVLLSAANAQVRQAEGHAMREAEEKKNAEARKVLSQDEARKVSTAYKTNYECALKFVEERAFVP